MVDFFDVEMIKYYVFRSGFFDIFDYGFVFVDFFFEVIIVLVVNGYVVVW